MNKDEFYIGWMDKAPSSFVAFVRKYIFALVPVVIALAVIFALSQKKFGKGTFEFGTLTEVEGVYFSEPFANIKVVAGKDIFGNSSFITIPLIGYGKFGADGIISDIEKEKNISLEGKRIKLKGTLLYNDGKVLMQVDGNDKPLVNVSETVVQEKELIQLKQLGNIEVKGEIVDPKCFFGVMKPGEGKPHKDCAIRCILGGIPPVLHVTARDGSDNYYFIVGSNGGKMNRAVKDFVAAPVQVKAKAVQYNDWIVLYTDWQGISEISRSEFYQPGVPIACASPLCK